MTPREAFPLHWPHGWKRTKNPKRSRFTTTFGSARDELMAEIRRMGGKNPILSTDIPLRRDGLPYSNHNPPRDKGAAVYFQYKGNPMSFACDAWDRVQDNVWAIRKTIEALRGIERWGASDMLERAFTGFQALPPARGNWWDVLEVSESASVYEIKEARKRLSLIHHPDKGGHPDMMVKINKAFDDAMHSKGV